MRTLTFLFWKSLWSLKFSPNQCFIANHITYQFVIRYFKALVLHNRILYCFTVEWNIIHILYEYFSETLITIFVLKEM